MKAAVVQEIGVVSVERVDDPTPGPREVVVEVAACGLCGTDLHILRGEFAPRLPVIPGHEFAGTVVAVGTEVDELAPGARVAVDPSLYCHECYYCRNGHENLCERWRAVGVTNPGAAAQFVAAPVANCVPVPADIRLEDAALIEPLSCAVRGYDVLQNGLASTVLVYGAGTMGLIMLTLARSTGASTVAVVDTNAERLSTASQLGAGVVASNADDLPDVAPGWEVVIDATGNQAAIQDGLARVAKGGTFLQFGVADYAARVSIEPYRIYNQEITITGSMAVLHSYERAARLFAAGLIDPDVFITHRLPLDDYRTALDMVAGGVGRKVQVRPGA